MLAMKAEVSISLLHSRAKVITTDKDHFIRQKKSIYKEELITPNV